LDEIRVEAAKAQAGRQGKLNPGATPQRPNKAHASARVNSKLDKVCGEVAKSEAETALIVRLCSDDLKASLFTNRDHIEGAAELDWWSQAESNRRPLACHTSFCSSGTFFKVPYIA
jgi:hypothetical protein